MASLTFVALVLERTPENAINFYDDNRCLPYRLKNRKNNVGRRSERLFTSRSTAILFYLITPNYHDASKTIDSLKTLIVILPTGGKNT